MAECKVERMKPFGYSREEAMAASAVVLLGTRDDAKSEHEKLGFAVWRKKMARMAEGLSVQACTQHSRRCPEGNGTEHSNGAIAATPSPPRKRKRSQVVRTDILCRSLAASLAASSSSVQPRNESDRSSPEEEESTATEHGTGGRSDRGRDHPGSATTQSRWLEDRFRFSNDEITKILGQAPDINTLDVSVLKQRADWLTDQLALGNGELRRMVKRQPTILHFIPERNLDPKLGFLKRRLGLDRPALSKILQSNPAILGYSSENNIEPKLRYLEKRLNLDHDALGKLVKRRPGILNLSIPNNLEPTVRWFQQRMGLSEAETTRILTQQPGLLHKSVSENMEPKLRWLQKRLELTDAQLFRTIQRFPALFTCSIENNLEPTFRFHEEFLGTEETIRLLKPDPSLFSYSLEKRLKPRMRKARELGLEIDKGMLQRIAKYTDEKWHKSIGRGNNGTKVEKIAEQSK